MTTLSGTPSQKSLQPVLHEDPAPRRELAAPRILMIAGARFVGSVVKSHSSHVASAAPVKCAALRPMFSPTAREAHDWAEGFEHVSWFPSPDRKVLPWLREPMTILRSFWDTAPGPLRWQDRGLKHRAWSRLYWAHSRVKLPAMVKGYDIFHWHSLVPDFLPALDAFPRHVPLILTLWGSDLYRTAGVEEYRRQLRACDLATVVTMATVEMKETFLSKFGREWSGKIRTISYGADHLEDIDDARGMRDTFLMRMGIPPSAIVICVGHNAHWSHRHLDVLSAIESLAPVHHTRIAVLIPMTYGRDTEYVDEVRRKCATLRCPVRIIESYLPARELAALRCASDIMVHVPITDQFSAAMCEAVYAGSVLITGAWLPYSRLRLAGIPLREIATTDELTTAIDGVLRDFKSLSESAHAKAPIMKRMMSWEHVAPQWIELYQDLLAGSRGRR